MPLDLSCCSRPLQVLLLVGYPAANLFHLARSVGGGLYLPSNWCAARVKVTLPKRRPWPDRDSRAARFCTSGSVSFVSAP